MLIWYFTELGVEIAVGACFPDKVHATVTIPYREMERISKDLEEYQKTRLEITKDEHSTSGPS